MFIAAQKAQRKIQSKKAGEKLPHRTLKGSNKERERNWTRIITSLKSTNGSDMCGRNGY